MATVTRKEWDTLIRDLENAVNVFIEAGLELIKSQDGRVYELRQLVGVVQRAIIFLHDWRESIGKEGE
jgi:hypothetical protein